MKILKFEDKVKNWIENNRIKWGFILLGVGLGLGIFSNFLFGGAIKQGVTIGMGYAFLLVFIEYTSGGSGID